MKRIYLALAACALLAGGCGNNAGQPCRSDSDCGGQVCTRIGECASQSQLITIRTAWTINGAAPNPTAPQPCSGIDSLEVDYGESGGVIAGFRPVPCDIGFFRVDRMPPWLDRVQVVAYGPNMFLLADGSTALPGDKNTDVTVDLVTH